MSSIQWNVLCRERIKGLKDLYDNKLLHNISISHTADGRSYTWTFLKIYVLKRNFFL